MKNFIAFSLGKTPDHAGPQVPPWPLEQQLRSVGSQCRTETLPYRTRTIPFPGEDVHGGQRERARWGECIINRDDLEYPITVEVTTDGKEEGRHEEADSQHAA